MDKKTGLRKLSVNSLFAADPSHTGFVLLGLQGKNLTKGKGAKIFDTDYVSSDNADVQTVDHLVDDLLAQGLVDEERIYAVGVGGGANMAILYTMLRPNRVAAAAITEPPHVDISWTCPDSAPPMLAMAPACTPKICHEFEEWLKARAAVAQVTNVLYFADKDNRVASCDACSKEGPEGALTETKAQDLVAFFRRFRLTLKKVQTDH